MTSTVDNPPRNESLARACIHLEWSTIWNAVAQRCRGPLRERLALSFATSREGMVRALEESREAASLIDTQEELPLDGIADVAPLLQRVERAGVLEAVGLRDIQRTLRAARLVYRHIASRKSRVPRLFEACQVNPTLITLEDDLAHSIESDGTISDRASTELKTLRTEVGNLRDRISARLEEIIQKHSDLLSDNYFTIREGRYVVPVRKDAHEGFPGIVHGTSSSGSSVFVEPRALVALGNRLRMALSDLEREEQRILVVLSDLVRERVHDVNQAVLALDHADLCNARARFGRDLGCHYPTVSDVPRLRVRAFRHPALLLAGTHVVPNDVSIESGHALVVSGPNAGGKTVALKCAGLAALMPRAGLPLPCGIDPEVGFFEHVLSDIGDEQSIGKNLSTFSAHIVSISQTIASCTGNSLVLLDEVATGTDPAEGAALACAIVDELCRRGGAVIVTTHYEMLKTRAFSDARLRNASVGLDVATMTPTFELRWDLPGSSNALVVAARFGLADSVIERAKEFLPTDARAFDELVRRLEEQIQKTRTERETLAVERSRLNQTQTSLDEELARVRNRENKILDKAIEELSQQARETHQALAEARKQLRETPTKAELQQAAKATEEAGQLAAEAKAVLQARNPIVAAPPVAAETLRLGERVWVRRLNAEGEVIELPEKGRVRVAVGVMKLYVPLEELGQVRAPVSQGTQEQKATTASRSRSGENSLDVRGMRVDDALLLLETFVDRLYGEDVARGIVLHGFGTGALRESIRARLAEFEEKNRYVSRFGPGKEEEGGERVTVFYLR